MHLSLAEKFLLLATDPESGRNLSFSLPQGLAAALLSELVLLKRVDVADGDVRMVSADSTGCELLDAALRIIASAQSAMSVESCIPALTGIRELGRRVGERLVARGLMVNRGHHALGVIPYHRYEVKDQTLWAELEQNVRAAILHPDSAAPADRSLAAVLSVCGPCPRGLKRQASELAANDAVASGLRRAMDNEAAAAAMISAMC